MRPVPNLEVNYGSGEENRQFFVPVGTINIAQGKSVFSSDDNPIIGSISMVNDGICHVCGFIKKSWVETERFRKGELLLSPVKLEERKPGKPFTQD